jgi:hypothetical protein
VRPLSSCTLALILPFFGAFRSHRLHILGLWVELSDEFCGKLLCMLINSFLWFG